MLFQAAATISTTHSDSDNRLDGKASGNPPTPSAIGDSVYLPREFPAVSAIE